MKHRQRAAISQRLPETAFDIARSYFFGVLGVLAGLAFLIFYFGLVMAIQQ